MTRCPYNLDKPCGSPPEPSVVPLEDAICDAIVGPLLRHLPQHFASALAEELASVAARAVVDWQAGS